MLFVGGCQTLLDFDELNLVLEAPSTSVLFSGTNITWLIPEHDKVQVYTTSLLLPPTFFTSLEIVGEGVKIESISTFINNLQVSIDLFCFIMNPFANIDVPVRKVLKL